MQHCRTLSRKHCGPLTCMTRWGLHSLSQWHKTDFEENILAIHAHVKTASLCSSRERPLILLQLRSVHVTLRALVLLPLRPVHHQGDIAAGAFAALQGCQKGVEALFLSINQHKTAKKVLLGPGPAEDGHRKLLGHSCAAAAAGATQMAWELSGSRSCMLRCT